MLYGLQRYYSVGGPRLHLVQYRVPSRLPLDQVPSPHRRLSILTVDAGCGCFHRRRDRLWVPRRSVRVSPPWVHNGFTLVIPSFVHAVQGRLGACHSHRRHWLGVSTADAVRLGVCSALTLVSPPRVHTRDPVVRARSAGQAGGLPFSPQPPVGCLHRRRGRPGMLGAHARESASGSRS